MNVFSFFLTLLIGLSPTAFPAARLGEVPLLRSETVPGLNATAPGAALAALNPAGLGARLCLERPAALGLQLGAMGALQAQLVQTAIAAPIQAATALQAQTRQPAFPSGSPLGQLESLGAAAQNPANAGASQSRAIFSAHFDHGPDASSAHAPPPVAEFSDPVAGELETLRVFGHGVFPGDLLFAPALEERLTRTLEAIMKEGDLLFSRYLDFYNRATGGWTRVLALQEILGEVRESLEGFTERLKASLPGEDFILRDVTVRRVRGEVPEAGYPHVDQAGTYLVFTKTLKQRPSSVLYLPRGDGTFLVVQPDPGLVVGMTGSDREEATGVEGTLHSAHPKKVEDGFVVIVRYQSTRPIAVSDAVNARVQRRQALVREYLLH